MKPSYFLPVFLVLICHQVFGAHFKGRTSQSFNSVTDSVYVAAIWHYSDGRAHVAGEQAVEITDGKFTLELPAVPPQEGVLSLHGADFSVAYIVLFRDNDGNKRYDRKTDAVVGVAENHCLTYVNGDWNGALDKIEQQKGRKTQLRKLAQAIQLARVIRYDDTEEFQFDGLETIGSNELIIIRVAPKEDLDFPNWT